MVVKKTQKSGNCPQNKRIHSVKKRNFKNDGKRNAKKRKSTKIMAKKTAKRRQKSRGF